MQAAFADTILQIMIECILHAIPCYEHTWTNEPNSCVFSKMHSVRGRTGHERTWIDKIADRRSPNHPPAHSNTHNFALFVVSDIKMQSALCGSLFHSLLVHACVWEFAQVFIAWLLRWWLLIFIYLYQSRPFVSAAMPPKPLTHFANHHKIFDTLFTFHVIDFYFVNYAFERLSKFFFCYGVNHNIPSRL